ncbi:MAG: class I SAM-dependent methyltransferase [Chloroflexia bacterium]
MSGDGREGRSGVCLPLPRIPWLRRILAWFLRHLYGTFAWAYDVVAWWVSFGRWVAWGEAALPLLGGGSVLEVGCGTGRLLSRLVERGRAVGCDVSRAMLRQAHRRLRSRGGPVPLCQARAQALPFPSGAFEAVVSVFPTAYVYDPACWAEFRRVLKRGGRVVVVHSVQAGRAIPLRLAGALLEQEEGQKLPAEGFRVSLQCVPVGRDRVLVYMAERSDGTDVG